MDPQIPAKGQGGNREERGYRGPEALPTYLLPSQCKPYGLLEGCAFHFKTLGRKQRNPGTGTRK